ncbi:MAG: type II toxin-antitoxin system Phd/YefM family antitoxin [Capsulimonadaceae bacterium]
MKTIDAAAVKNPLADIGEMARIEPVTVLSHGEPIAIILSPQEYERLTGTRVRPRQGGFMKELFAGVDWDEVLAQPVPGFPTATGPEMLSPGRDC